MIFTVYSSSQLWYSWGPVKFTTTNYMYVQMKNCLSSHLSIVYHYTTTLQLLFFRYFGCCHHELSKGLLVLFVSIGESAKFSFFFRDDKDVDISDRIDIFEGENVFVLIDDGCGYLFADDFVEDGCLTH